jgi:hypothetical protein
MKKTLFIALAVVSLTSCEKWFGGGTTEPTPGNIVVSGHLTEDTHWVSDSTYEMVGKVVVDSGVTLTIDSCTTILAREGQGSSASALIVARGGKIMAEGTESCPIIFTSVLSEEVTLDETDMGLWGGIVILGNAPISADASPANIEGVPVNEDYGLYGGDDQTDNSGVFTYVSIRHAGALIGDGNELNGLTLGGVGRGTTISNIEVVANLDDGIEFFGGCVNASNLIVWAQGDDAFDVDQGWFGVVNNYVNVEGTESDHGLELDGGEGLTNPYFRFERGTFLSTDGVEFHFRDLAVGSVQYDYMMGTANIEADSATSVLIDATVGADTSVFGWTMTHEAGKL